MNRMLAQCARVTRDLCLLRGDPQDMPHSPPLLAGLIAAGIAADGVAGAILGDARAGLMSSSLSALIVFGLCKVALSIRRLDARYVQTATALAACSLVFSLLHIGMALIAGPPAPIEAAVDPVTTVVGLAGLALLFAQMAVFAHIMRHAMESSFGFALALVASWIVALIALGAALFPEVLA